MNYGNENEFVEFKKSTSEIDKAVVSLTSMLNKNGVGTVYFGVKNDGTLIGQAVSERTLRDISQVIANNIKPQIIPTIVNNYVDGKNVITVEVKGNDKPYSAFGKYYIRSFDEDREIQPNELKELLIRSNKTDIISEIDARNQELTFNQLKNLYNNKGININEKQFEKNLGLYNKDNKYNLMAELLSDNNSISIKVVTFKGKDKTEIVRRNEYGFKCLLPAMDTVLNYVESLNETKVTLTHHQRIEEQLFDFSCFKEAWQNACLHTKWERMNPPAVYIFEDRMEIISTGGLLADLSEEEFFDGVSRPVNLNLQKIFGQLGYVEQTGHGVPLVKKVYGEQAFKISENFVNVVIPFNNFNEEIDKKDLNNKYLEVLKYLKDNPKAKRTEISDNLSISEGYTKKIIHYLKDNNYIVRVGSNKDGYWQVK